MSICKLETDCRNMPISKVKLQGYIDWFNEVLADYHNTDYTEPYAPLEDDARCALDSLKSEILKLKKELGITENLQKCYF